MADNKAFNFSFHHFYIYIIRLKKILIFLPTLLFHEKIDREKVPAHHHVKLNYTLITSVIF